MIRTLLKENGLEWRVFNYGFEQVDDEKSTPQEFTGASAQPHEFTLLILYYNPLSIFGNKISYLSLKIAISRSLFGIIVRKVKCAYRNCREI